MKYIVSGSRRTGTSMMMRALMKGRKGLKPVINQHMERANRTFQGYKPNPNGLYEVGPIHYFDIKFLHKHLVDSCLIKILFDGLPTLPASDYKIIFMDRDEKEVLASIKIVEEHLEAVGINDGKNWAKARAKDEEITKMLPFFCLRPHDQQDIDDVLAICKMRRDFDVKIINYAEVIENPLEVFTRLQDWGWPIDPEKCASAIDKSLYRVRKTA